jgi:hypothetical protein
MKTCPPGRRAGTAALAQITKNSRRISRSLLLSAVNRGSGDLTFPSNDGGILQIPPLPAVRFSIWSSSYSFTP